MTARKISSLIFIVSCFASPGASALGPYEAYQKAAAHDPVFLKAQQDHAAAQENSNISRASLLPNLSAETRNTPRNNQTVTATAPTGEELSLKRRYSSNSATLTMSQPLFDLQRWNRHKQTKKEVQASHYGLMEATQNLIIRVFEAYIEALYARDQYRIARSQFEAYAEELKRNRSAYRTGDATRTDVAETEAQVRASEVSLEDANDTLLVAMQKLSQITGVKLESIKDIAPIRPRYLKNMPSLKTQTAERWRDIAMKNNMKLLQARMSIEEARAALKRVRSEYAPTVNLVAEHARNKPQTDSTLNQRYKTSSIGIAVNIPLYSGGSTSAGVRQATHQIESRMREADAIINDIMTNLDQRHRLLASGLMRITARQRAVKAAEIALTGNRVAVIVGERVNVDVLDATQRLFSARSALNRAIYDNLKAIIYLKYYAGILSPSDIEEINGLFEG